MWELSLTNLWAKKSRLISTSTSVLVGVAFLAGSLVLLDTIGRTFDGLFATINEDLDAAVRSSEVVESQFVDVRGRVDEDVAEIVGSVPGVAAIDPGVEGYAQLVLPDGEPLGNPGQGPPTLGFSWGEVDELNPMELVEGRPPAGPTEVVIDRQSANDGPFLVGDSVKILLQGPPRDFTVVGIATFGSADTALGATMSMFDLGTAQELLAEPGKLNTIGVLAEDGVSQAELKDRIATALPDGAEVLTGEELTEEQQTEVADALGFFNTFMLVFALIALFVAAFIIYNTFSILVAQRTREMALLRALGARKRQLLGSVLIEAFVVGLVASALGVLAGIGVASLLKQMLNALGFGIPAGGIAFEPSTAYYGILVGVGVTMISAVMPARRASRIAPMAAIRQAEVGQAGDASRRYIIGGVGLAVGVGLLAWGLFGSPSNAATIIGVAAALVFIGVSALSPLIAQPFSRIVGAPIARVGGVPGELAQENAMRNPRRTSTTAAALMIGVGLVGAISIFAESAKASIAATIDESFVGDVVVDSGSFGFGGLSPALADELNERPEVDAASGIRLGFADIDGNAELFYGIDPATMGEILDVGVVEGDMSALDENDLAVHTERAADEGWKLGDTVTMRFPETGTQEFEVALLFADNDLTGSDYFVGNPAFEANVPDVYDSQVYVLRNPEFTTEAAVAAVESVAAGYANAEVQNLDEYKQSQADDINQLLNLVYALLALAIIIALIGIANTLALSTVERTREIGLLRAVGMTQRQLRRSIRWESVIISLLGTTLGLAVGLFFGWVIVQALADEGIGELRVPIGQLLIVVILAALAGILAAANPSRRAAKFNILRAIAAE
jgi:putative ABC transport system permease protein